MAEFDQEDSKKAEESVESSHGEEKCCSDKKATCHGWIENCKCELSGDYKSIAAIVIAFLGVLLQFSSEMETIGMALVGLVVGTCFYGPVLDCLRSIRTECGQCKAKHGLVFLAFGITLLLQLPALLIGAVVAALIRQFLEGSRKK
ncbi:MAG: hypothetical protein KDK40_01705 [Chlamydiia bacterium]|nr:hypothetical protein [Chlamydiia bacterium]